MQEGFLTSVEILCEDDLFIRNFIDTIYPRKGYLTQGAFPSTNQFKRVHAMRTKSDKVKELQRQIEELKQRWPAHSIPPAMLQRLDELDAELEDVLSSTEEGDDYHGEPNPHT
jgi:hypothetical protein